MEHRDNLLSRLALFEEPSAPLIDELRAMGWDWLGEPLLVLTEEHFVRIMDRFLVGQLTADQVVEWAENLEQREDVGFSQDKPEALDELLFCLANPDINYAITPQNIEQLKRDIAEG